jgi:hypothetical protein
MRKNYLNIDKVPKFEKILTDIKFHTRAHFCVRAKMFTNLSCIKKQQQKYSKYIPSPKCKVKIFLKIAKEATKGL